MGIGDELMVAGEARRLIQSGARKVGMLDKNDIRRWHFAWEGNPDIARPGEDCDALAGYVNRRRHYLVDETQIRRTFRAYTPLPARLVIPEAHRRLASEAAGWVVFNPTIKQKAPLNKDWGIERWKELVALTPEVSWLQVGDHSSPRIRGARHIPTAHFFDACALLSGARAAVLHEGALHHAAAALEVPAIVIRGGYISPKVTGYAGQVDFYIESEEWPLGCGTRINCPHCRQAMADITPAAVAEGLRKLLKRPA